MDNTEDQFKYERELVEKVIELAARGYPAYMIAETLNIPVITAGQIKERKIEIIKSRKLLYENKRLDGTPNFKKKD